MGNIAKCSCNNSSVQSNTLYLQAIDKVFESNSFNKYVD